MNMRDKQARAYLKESKLSIESAKASLERAEEKDKDL